MAGNLITSSQVAKKAGVSQSTVAHILNRTPGLKFAETTRKRVIRLANEMGYQRSLLARSIKRPLKHIGIAVGEAYGGSEYNAEAAIFNGVRIEAFGKGYIPVIEALPTKIADYSEAIRRMLLSHHSRLVDGFLVDSVSFGDKSITTLRSQGIPLVVTNGSPVTINNDNRATPAVNVDSAMAGMQAAEHLFSLGHRRIAMITRMFSNHPKPWRPWHIGKLIEGFTDAFEKMNLRYDPQMRFESEPSDILNIISIVEQMLAMPDPPTAIFAADDAMAVAVINALGRRGKKVPHDISVMGYGDWSPAVYLSPCPLSTIRCPLQESGKLAMRMLIEILEGRGLKERQIVLPTEMIPRSSTTPPAIPDTD